MSSGAAEGRAELQDCGSTLDAVSWSSRACIATVTGSELIVNDAAKGCIGRGRVDGQRWSLEALGSIRFSEVLVHYKKIASAQT